MRLPSSQAKTAGKNKEEQSRIDYGLTSKLRYGILISDNVVVKGV
jgi:hypothetical protein